MLPPKLESTNPEEIKRWADDLYRMLGQISLGDGTIPQGRGQNLDMVWVSGITDVTPGIEKAFTHKLGRLPVGVLAMINQFNSFIYLGATPMTTTTIYLASSPAGAIPFKVLVF